MKLPILITALVFLNSFTSPAQTPGVDAHWTLAWEDNFNTLNTNTWLVQNHFDHYGEPQIYKTSNVSVTGGNLVISTKLEDYLCPSANLNQWECKRQATTGKLYNYTSGWIESKQAYNKEYGYIESRMKIPYGYGFWPAFWTFAGAGITASNAAEIDIYEMLGHWPSNTVTTNVHVAYPDGDPHFEVSVLDNFVYSDWHVYGIEWSPDRIIWYIDGRRIRTLYNHGVVDPVRIIINTAIEPSYQPLATTTTFPGQMFVDYVRVYDLKMDCNTTINACNFLFMTYNNKVKKEIILGGNSCEYLVPENANIHLRATDGVLFNGDFTVPLGAQLYVDVNNFCK